MSRVSSFLWKACFSRTVSLYEIRWNVSKFVAQWNFCERVRSMNSLAFIQSFIAWIAYLKKHSSTDPLFKRTLKFSKFPCSNSLLTKFKVLTRRLGLRIALNSFKASSLEWLVWKKLKLLAINFASSESFIPLIACIENFISLQTDSLYEISWNVSKFFCSIACIEKMNLLRMSPLYE